MEKIILNEITKSTEDIISSSSDSDTSDSEIEIKIPQKIIKIENYIANVVHKYSNAEFRTHFRLSRSCCEDLILHYGNVKLTSYRGGWPKISPEKTVLMTLWYLANNESFKQIADRFNVALSSAHHYISSFANILAKESKNKIKWPTNNEAQIISQEFYRNHKIPNVIGCIDGCHVRISKPKCNGDDYINRNNFPSIILQGVANHKKLFTNVCIGCPGSSHDARVLRKSKIYEIAENGNDLFYGQYHLLGDSAYPLLNWLIPPFKDTGLLIEEQHIFNQHHSRCRIVIEHTFGLLKGRFRRLREHQNNSLPIIIDLVMAACVLHNICVLEQDDGEDFREEVEVIYQDDENQEYGNAHQKRDYIMQNLIHA